MDIQPFFDKDTATFTYVISDSETNACAIIDSVLNYDLFSGKISTYAADHIINYIKDHHLNVEWILETHVHADHLTGAYYLREKVGGKIGVGSSILNVLNYWVPLFNTKTDTPLTGEQFDHLFEDNDIFAIGNIQAKVWHTPGHTPACVSYLIDNTIFVGDTIFMPYVGTARTDFPGGNAETLYDSIQKIMALPDATKIYVGHDYPLEGNNEQCVTTIEEQKLKNIMVHQGISKTDYVTARNTKDKGKSVPRLLLPALQVNLRAGYLGEAENNGIQYIKIPLNQFE